MSLLGFYVSRESAIYFNSIVVRRFESVIEVYKKRFLPRFQADYRTKSDVESSLIP